MYKAFISSRQSELQELRKMAVRPCMRNGIDPFFFEWDVAPAEEIVKYLAKRIKESHLFIGIYGAEYGSAGIPSPDNSSEMVSPIDFEMQLALRHIGQDSVLLFAKEGVDREPELRSLIQNRVYKGFATENEFALTLDEAIKKWIKWQEHRHESIVPDDLLVSIETSSPDKSGILSAIYRALFRLGGNVTRARQTVHLGKATIRALVQWDNKPSYPGEEATKEAVEHELYGLYANDSRQAVKVRAVRIRSREGEVKAKGNFQIQFFDAPGIAERVFAVFAEASISVLESQLEQVAPNPPISVFNISANVTNVSRERISMLADKLRSLAGIFFVREDLEFGSWWY